MQRAHASCGRSALHLQARSPNVSAKRRITKGVLPLHTNISLRKKTPQFSLLLFLVKTCFKLQSYKRSYRQFFIFRLPAYRTLREGLQTCGCRFCTPQAHLQVLCRGWGGAASGRGGASRRGQRPGPGRPLSHQELWGGVLCSLIVSLQIFLLRKHFKR